VTELELALDNEVGAGAQSIAELAIQVEPISGACERRNLLEQALRTWCSRSSSTGAHGRRSARRLLWRRRRVARRRIGAHQRRCEKVCRLVSPFPMPYRDSARIRIPPDVERARARQSARPNSKARTSSTRASTFHAHWTAASAARHRSADDWRRDDGRRRRLVRRRSALRAESAASALDARRSQAVGRRRRFPEPLRNPAPTPISIARSIDAADHDRWRGEVRRDARDGRLLEFLRWRRSTPIPSRRARSRSRNPHARPTTLALEPATTFFYAKRGAKIDGVAPDALATLDSRVEGRELQGRRRLEAEALAVHGKSDGLTTAVEARDGATVVGRSRIGGRANGQRQFVELELPVARR